MSQDEPVGNANAVVRGALTLAALLAAALLVLRLVDVILMAFAAVLVGVLLNALAGSLQKRVGLGRMTALTLAVVVVAVTLVLMVWGFGSQAEAQLANLSDLLPRAWRDLHQRLGGSPAGALMLRELDGWLGSGRWLVGLGPQMATNVAASVAGAVIVVFAGLYLAYHPQSYLAGFLLLFPREARARAAQVMAACDEALRHWLVGQLFSMALVGVTTGVGLALVGVPAPIALGMIAGVGQFVPVVGPMAATIPGLLTALAVGPETFAWAAGVYLVSSQVEANLITPLMMRQMAQLPMAVTLFAVLAMGVLLGPLGVLLATPLAVVLYVFVNMVYVQDVLGEKPPPTPQPRLKRRG
ncbi:MAG TPA: AI-2E family transporter [Phenylobacterium sp.]|nr:AI-2E family transporter [Phenylobacterium sp.]